MEIFVKKLLRSRHFYCVYKKLLGQEEKKMYGKLYTDDVFFSFLFFVRQNKLEAILTHFIITNQPFYGVSFTSTSLSTRKISWCLRVYVSPTYKTNSTLLTFCLNGPFFVSFAAKLLIT